MRCHPVCRCLTHFPFRAPRETRRRECERLRNNLPHLHAKYAEFEASISIEDGEILAGKLPRKQLRLVQAWIELRHDELLADWELSLSGEQPYKITPL
ncbi:MAG: DUF4160 domain-containing protein [Anaerolineae bacterium]|uniref:DUF4160 domain-containing protein n=1 Tax=Candidatus Amarolinea dominans TaxID=3140696 RepID=UPI00313722AA|nr:DUF4160 domain-containing protein [Anaerolineae bacterium]